MSRSQSSCGNRTSNMVGRGKVPPVIPGSVVAQRLAKRPIRHGSQEPIDRKCNGHSCQPVRITNLLDHKMKQEADRAQRRRLIPRSVKVSALNDLTDFDTSLGSLLKNIQADIAQRRIQGDNGMDDDGVEIVFDN